MTTPIERRPAHTVILEQLRLLQTELEPPTGTSLMEAGVFNHMAAVMGLVPIKTDLLITLLANIEMSDEVLESVRVELHEILSELRQRINKADDVFYPSKNKLSQEAQIAAAESRVFGDHFVRLSELVMKYGLQRR